MGQRQGERIIWHHVWTLDSSRIEKMVVGSGYCGALPSKRALYCFSIENAAYGIPVGPDTHPARASWPKLADYSEASVATNTHVKCCSAIDFEGLVQFTPGSKAISIEMEHIQSVDTLGVYARWGEKAAWKFLGDWHGRGQFVAPAPDGMGRTLSIALQFQDGSRSAVAPHLHRVTIMPNTWEYLDPSVDWGVQEQDYDSPAIG